MDGFTEATPPGVDHLRALREDLRKYYRIHLGAESPPWRRRLELWGTHLGLHCVAAYRLSRAARAAARSHRWAALPLTNAARLVETGLELLHHVRITAEIGPGFYLGHAGNVFIGPTVVGRNFSATHNVTVGVGHSDATRGVPRIGDDVWIGTGAVLSGAIEIGSGATVACGTMLSRDAPPGALVGGNPGRVVLQPYDNAALMGAGREAEAIPLRRAALRG